MNIFQERLSGCMHKKGINGADLAAMTGISGATISRYLNGLRSPSPENIAMLSDALWVTSDYLLGLSDVTEGRFLMTAYSKANAEDRRVIWTLLERYGGMDEPTNRK